MATETSQAAPYIFLSYASADREWALPFADLLEAQGVSVWIDRKSVARSDRRPFRLTPANNVSTRQAQTMLSLYHARL